MFRILKYLSRSSILGSFIDADPTFYGSGSYSGHFFGNDIFDTSVSNHVAVSAEERGRVPYLVPTHYHNVSLEISSPVCRSPCWIVQTKDSSGTVTCSSRSSAIPRCFSLVYNVQDLYLFLFSYCWSTEVSRC